MVGEILRREREKQGLSIADVAGETSIRDVYLEAIEKGDYDALPGDVYAKGFIRNYSKFLQIDGNALLEQYDSERNIVKVVQPADMPREDEASEPKKSFFGRNKGAEKPAARAETSSSTGYSRPQAKTSLFAAGDEYRHSLEREEKSGSKKFMILLGVMLVFLGGVYVAFMDEGTDPAAKPKPAVKQEQPVKQEPAAPVKVYEGAEVSAKMLENCWISVKVDGQNAFEGTVEKGKEMSWKGKESVEIRAGNAGGIQVTFNGKDMGTLGEIGQIADRTFVKEAAAPQAGVNDEDGNAGQAAGGQAGAAEQSYYQESYSEPAPAEPAAPAAPAEAAQPEAPAAGPQAQAPAAAEQGQPAAAAQ